MGEDCTAIKARSREALRNPDRERPEPLLNQLPPLPTDHQGRFDAYCRSVMGDPGSRPVELVEPLMRELALGELEGLARRLIQTCQSCHLAGAAIGQIPALSDRAAFRNFLNQRAPSGERWLDGFLEKLASGEMPPEGWTPLNSGLEATEGAARDQERRDVIRGYVEALTAPPTQRGRR
jgi:hypothetical protein